MIYNIELHNLIFQRHPQDLAGGGGQEIFFFRFGEAMRFAEGVREHVPRENVLKWCNLVRFAYIWISMTSHRIISINAM